MRGFNNDWKRALELINGDVMRAFTNFKNGTQILQVFIIAGIFVVFFSSGNINAHMTMKNTKIIPNFFFSRGGNTVKWTILCRLLNQFQVKCITSRK